MAEQSPESPMVSVSSQSSPEAHSSPETPFQNELPLSPSTTNSAEVGKRDSSLRNMFDGLHSVENQFDQQFDQLLHSPYFTASNEVRQNSERSNSNYDTESLKEELDAALLASPASIANKRRGGPILVETVNEDSSHQTYSDVNMGPKGRPSAEDLMHLFPAPASAPPPPPPSSVGSSSTAPPPPAASAAAAAAPDLRPPNAKLPAVSQHSEIDDSSHFLNFEGLNFVGLQKLDNRIASLRKASYFAKANNVKPRRSSAYDPHVDSLRRELNEAALDAPSVVEEEPELAPLDEDGSSQELSIIVPQEDDAMARKYTIAVAVLVGCNCFLLIWILAMIIVLASRD
jgi:hypothetical protein